MPMLMTVSSGEHHGSHGEKWYAREEQRDKRDHQHIGGRDDFAKMPTAGGEV
jgi:hypothetical protein